MSAFSDFLSAGDVSGALLVAATGGVAFLSGTISQRIARQGTAKNARVESNRETLAEVLVATIPFIEVEYTGTTYQGRIDLCRESLGKVNNLRGKMLLLGDEATSEAFEKLHAAARQSFKELNSGEPYTLNTRENMENAYENFVAASNKYLNKLI